jgi:hypothetical protein
MRANKDWVNPEQPAENKFLTRQYSATNFPLFGCCATSAYTELETDGKYLKKIQPDKLSMKQLMKKSAMYGASSSEISHIPSHLTSKKSVSTKMIGPGRRKPS